MLSPLEFVLFTEPVLDGDAEQDEHAGPDDAGGDAGQERAIIREEEAFARPADENEDTGTDEGVPDVLPHTLYLLRLAFPFPGGTLGGVFQDDAQLRQLVADIVCELGM